MLEAQDLSKTDLYAGFSGMSPPPIPIELGGGLVLSSTFAHLLQPKLMAFSPAPRGKPHPVPWAAVDGGGGCDIHCQLFVPREFDLEPCFDKLSAIWWLAALIRLRGFPHAFVPAISTAPFSVALASSSTARILAIGGSEPTRFPISLSVEPSESSIFEWIREHWKRGAEMMHNSNQFRTLVQAVDFSLGRPSAPLAMIEIWGGLEQLFGETESELRFRVSLRLASYLKPFGPARRELCRSIMELYKARSKAAHGTKIEPFDDVTKSYLLARQAVMTIIERGTVPTRTELDELALGGSE